MKRFLITANLFAGVVNLAIFAFAEDRLLNFGVGILCLGAALLMAVEG